MKTSAHTQTRGNNVKTSMHTKTSESRKHLQLKREGKIVVGTHLHRGSEDLKQLRGILETNLEHLGERWSTHIGLFLGSAELARILWLNEVYRKICDIPGSVLEFGSQYGASFNLLNLLKMVYEPWNVARKMYAFSTFEEGFVDVLGRDGGFVKRGDYSVPANWKCILERILEIHSRPSPIGSAWEIVEGDVSKTLPRFLRDNKHAIVSLAHFDLDVYSPTKTALRAIIDRMPKGALLVFDELNHPAFPGETMAVQEVLGIKNLKLRKTQYQPYSCYCVVE